MRERTDPARATTADPATIARRLRELELTVSSLADLVVVVDEDKVVLECNGASDHVWGLSPSEVIGRPLPTLSGRVTLLDRQGNALPLERELTVQALVSHKRQRVATLGIRRADGSVIWAHVRATPLADEGGRQRVVSVWTDVTAAVGLETDVTRLHFEFERRVEARQAELTATITQLEGTIAELEVGARAAGEFNYSVAHDLRAPVRTISALAEAVLEELEEGGSAWARDLITRIHRNASRMDALIDALLQLATVSHVEPKHASIDLSAIAQQELQALADREPGRALTCIVPDGIVASGDAQLVQSVVANLLANAWKFTADVESPCIEIGVREPDGDADGPLYYVRDNGIGFEMYSADDIFLPFRRLDAAADFEGTGIGLALVHRIVTRHGGRVWAESAPGQGATFFFTLPPPA